MKTEPLTLEQLAQIAEFFKLNMPAEGKVLPVRDGRFVTLADTVWWRSEKGPQQVDAARHWDNIRSHPHLYQFDQPSFRAEYL